MEIVPREQRLDGHSLCTICEGYIDHPVEPAIDTNRDLHLFAGPHPLEGRKYVCQSCAHEIAVVSGYVKQEQAAALSEAEVEANTKLTEQLMQLMPLLEDNTFLKEAISAGSKEVGSEAGQPEERKQVRRAKVEANP